MIKVDTQTRVAHAIDDLREILEQPVVAHALVVERRQHQHPRAAARHGMGGELDRVRDRAAAGARHHPRGIDAPLDKGVEQLESLFETERVRLAVGAEHREAAVLREQPPAMPHEPVRIDG